MGSEESKGNDGVTKRILERKTAIAVSTKIDFSFRIEVLFITATSLGYCTYLVTSLATASRVYVTVNGSPLAL
ncbi:MAG TPA: hypothetical protein VF419_02170, partial [Nitrososphaeraceae archaeon]